MHVSRTGTGKPLLLVHGVGSNYKSWGAVAPALAEGRQVLAIDLPGHGASPAEHDSATFEGLVRSVEGFLDEEGLGRADMVGASLGGRVVLELARKGRAGHVVALDPGGFWAGWERTYLQMTLLASVFLLKGLRPAIPYLAHSAMARSALLVELSAHPWALDGELVANELQSYADTPTFTPLVNELATIPAQAGPAAPGSGNIAIGWGRQDRLCWPVQAERAQKAFPAARLHWFENCGHYPAWDQPDEALALILETIA